MTRQGLPTATTFAGSRRPPVTILWCHPRWLQIKTSTQARSSSSRTLKVELNPEKPSIFGSKDVRPFTILQEFMNKRPPVKKPQAKIQTVKKQIPVKKIVPDRVEELVKKHLGNIGEAENAFKSASALLEKHKTKYPEIEQYIEHVSPSDRSMASRADFSSGRLPKRIESQPKRRFLGWPS
jgi:hypothetical protein